MVVSSFLEGYAKYYDVLYQDKDYVGECSFVEEVFRRYSPKAPNTILDVGCGTGSHAIELSRRGYRVVGIDLSKAMVGIARRKVVGSDANKALDLAVMDARHLGLNASFDACICMFAVVSYITSNEGLSAFFKEVRRVLKPGSVFVFDFWYGPAVLTIKPSERSKVVKHGDLVVIRSAHPALDTLNHICRVKYSLFAVKNGVLVDEVYEEHVVRYLFPQEVRHYLEENGFRLAKLCAFPNLDRDPTESDWDVAAIAQAV